MTPPARLLPLAPLARLRPFSPPASELSDALGLSFQASLRLRCTRRLRRVSRRALRPPHFPVSDHPPEKSCRIDLRGARCPRRTSCPCLRAGGDQSHRAREHPSGRIALGLRGEMSFARESL